MTNSFVLGGLDGANPLAFLAALGTLRLSSLRWPGERVRMRWVRENGWRPEVSGVPAETDTQFCDELQAAPWAPLEAFAELGNNLTVPAEAMESVVQQIGCTHTERRAADFVTAFACEVIDDPKKNRVEYTELCFITGSGHQHFLGSAAALAKCCTATHLREALFGPWRVTDKGLSFRWDPEDAKEYALLYGNPSVEGAQSVWGANRLAFEGLPLLPVVPTERGLRTTGFHHDRERRADEFTWPIWTGPVSVDVVRSLLGLEEIQPRQPNRELLLASGVSEVFRAQRVRIGQGANFKVSFRPARAV